MGSDRYEAQLKLPELGSLGQAKVAQSRLLIVGLGGLGCASATYLAMAGVGHLRIVDGDHVALSNLSRQPLYTTHDLNHPKVEVAAERLRAINLEIEIEPIHHFMDRSNLSDLLAGIDLVVDGTDSLEARKLLNRAMVTRAIPVVFGAATGFHGSVITCSPGGPCYDCIWSEPAASSCETDGVFGPLVGMVGTSQAAEALRTLLGLSQPGRLQLIDAREGEWRSVKIRRRETCPTCGAEKGID